MFIILVCVTVAVSGSLSCNREPDVENVLTAVHLCAQMKTWPNSKSYFTIHAFSA